MDNEQNAQATVESLMIGASGNVSILVSRNTANIPYRLPFVVFGANDLQGGYNNLLKTALQNLEAINSGDPIELSIIITATGNVQFIYTQGAKSDTVTVSYVGSLNSYNSVLKAMNNDYFSSSLLVYIISDAVNGAGQINGNIIQLNAIGALAYSTQNELDLDSFILPTYNRQDRVSVVFPETKITADTGFIDSIIPCPYADIEADVPFTVKYALFTKNRFNLNRLANKN